MQMGVRRAGPHDVGASRLVRGRQSCGLRVKRPHDHPMGTYLDGHASRVIGIRIATLSSACQHVGYARDCVRWLGFVSLSVGELLQRDGIYTHGRLPNHFWIARHARETIVSFAQHYRIALRVRVNDSR